MYLDTEIRLRESDPKSAEMLNTLKDWRNRHEVQISTFVAQRDRGEAKKITIEEINKHLEDMFQLPVYGEKLKETHKKITEKDSMHYQEVCCRIQATVPKLRSSKRATVLESFTSTVASSVASVASVFSWTGGAEKEL